jgi:PKD repeat protein
MMRQFINNSIDLEWHGYYIFGSSKPTTTIIARSIGSQWNQNESATSLNLVVANNSARYDTIKFFPNTGYTYYPSETLESLYANGVKSTVSFTTNPLLNYQRKPHILALDDLFNGLENTSVDWIFETFPKYDIPITFATMFGSGYAMFPSAYNWNATQNNLTRFYNATLDNHGTLFEMTDHAYNHTSLASYPTEEYAYATFTASKIIWATLTSKPLYSEMLPFNAWGNGSWKGLSDAGVKNLRLSSWGSYDQITRDLDSGMFVVTCNYNGTTPFNQTTQHNIANAVGYVFTYHHVWSDMVTDSQRTTWVAYFKQLQNDTNIIPMTFSAFSDIWHHRISYDVVDGKSRIDLSNPTVQANHRIRLTNEDGHAKIFRDLTTGLPSYPVWLNSTEYYFDAEKGHVYEEIGMSVTTSIGALTVDLATYSPSLIRWTTNSTATSTVTFGLTGLDGTVGYKVYVDGVVIYQQGVGFTTLSFEYDGPWSEHTFEVVAWSSEPGSGPMASFEYRIVGDTIYLTDKSYNGPVVWVWNFGDGMGSTSQNPTHTYKASGAYTISLTVYDANAKSSVAQTVIEIVLGPENPIDQNEGGWSIWISDDMTLRVSALGVTVVGAIMYLSGMYLNLPVITNKGRKIIGILLMLLGAYYFIFIDNGWLG